MSEFPNGVETIFIILSLTLMCVADVVFEGSHLKAISKTLTFDYSVAVNYIACSAIGRLRMSELYPLY